MRSIAAAFAFLILAFTAQPALADGCVTSAATPPTQPEGATRPLSCDLNRNLRTSSGGSSGGATATGQTNTQAAPGSDAITATAVQGVTNGKPVPTSVASLPLPAGASTSANQTTGNGSLATIATNTTGAATAANQTTANTSLATIATNTGAATPAGSNLIGKTGIDQTTPGTTNGVAPDGVVDGVTGTSATLGSATQFAFASGLPVQGGSSNQNILMTGYGTFQFQILTNVSSNLIVCEGSDDNGTTWTNIALRSATGTGASAATSSGVTNAGNAYSPTTIMALMRLRISSFISGTTTIAVVLKRSVPPNVVDAFVGNTVSVLQNRTMIYADTTTPLASNATFTGTTRDAVNALPGGNGSNQASATMFGATFYSDQAGTAFIDESTDNSTWFMVATQAVTAGGGALVGPNFGLNVRIRARYYRVRFINGSVLEGALRITSSFTAS